MSADLIKSELEHAGWKQVQPASHMGFDFDLVGSRRFFFTKWDMLVKVLPLLDRGAAEAWNDIFKKISKQSKSYLWGRCFIMCLLAEEVSSEVATSLSGDGFGLFGVLRIQGGGGNVFVADMKSGQVHGKVPRLPYDIHKFSKSAQEILMKAIRAAS